ncbi:MAG: SDR family oxidoreductase [Bacteroidota bacterium]
MAYALVTGAAMGIGKAIANELACRNYNLLLVDMAGEELFEAAKELEHRFDIEALPLHFDLSDPGSIEQIFALTRPYHDQLSVVVNNAGYGLNGAFTELSLTEQLDIIDVNIKAVVKLSYAYIPVLKNFSRSFLLNVSSTTAYQSVPYLNVYAASKAFVLSFTRGLKNELKDSAVSVSSLSPGSTDTNFVNRARMSEATKQVARRYNMTPQAVATAAINGLFNGQAEIIPGFTNKLNASLPKFFPKWFVEKIAAGIYHKKEKWIDAIGQPELAAI